MKKAVFLDRDGTINEEVNYLHECHKLKFIPGTMEALRLLKEKGYLLIVVTNQSGVGRGYFSKEDVDRVHEYMNDLLRTEGAEIDGFYYCPHVEEDKCACRKPQTGLYLKAQEDFNIDFRQSYMVGDKITDILAAEKLGCGVGLVLSGHDISESYQKQYGEHCYRDLLEFARALDAERE